MRPPGRLRRAGHAIAASAGWLPLLVFEICPAELAGFSRERSSWSIPGLFSRGLRLAGLSASEQHPQSHKI